MPDHINRLEALQVERAKYVEQKTTSGALTGNRLSDGAGLFLYITPNGAKSWRFEYRFPKGGKRHILVYGSHPDLSLAEARKRHAKARIQLTDGLNPAEERKKVVAKSLRDQQNEEDEKKNAFRNVAADWLKETTEAKRKAGRPLSEVWESNVKRWLGWAYEEIGNKPLPDVEASDVLRIIRAAADRGTPTSAEFCRQTIARVFDYGIRTLRAPRGFNPADAVQGAVIVPPKRHRPKLDAVDLPAYLSAVDRYDGPESIKLGLKILLHCFTRKDELAAAPWKEIDLENRLWSIPKERMKSDRDHTVPLSGQVVAMFRRLRELAGDSEFVFPARSVRREGKPINEQTFNYAMNSLGYKGKFGPHGVRATAASILADRGYDVSVIDAQLAHREKDQTRAAYFRQTYLDKRRELLEAWSNMLDGYAAGGAQVIAINSGKLA